MMLPKMTFLAHELELLTFAIYFEVLKCCKIEYHFSLRMRSDFFEPNFPHNSFFNNSWSGVLIIHKAPL